MSAMPLLITGPARSGTTLVARMVAAHPRATVAVDPLFPVIRVIRNALTRAAGVPFDPAAPLQDGYGDLDRVRGIDAMVDGELTACLDATELAAIRGATADRCAIESPDLVGIARDVEGATAGTLLSGFLRDVAAARGVPRGGLVGVKEVWAADLVPAFLRAHPDARALLVRRDPRAVLASNLAMARHDAAQVAHPLSVLRHWRKQEAVAALLAAHPELRGRVMVVDFEALLTDPVAGTEALAGFLGLDDAAVLRDPERILDASGRPFVANTSFTADRAGIAPEAAERWRGRLPHERALMTDAVCAPELAVCGYCAVEPGDDTPDAALGRLVADDHARAWSWRSDLGDPAADLSVERARRAMWAAPEATTPPADRLRPLFLFPAAWRRLRPTTTGVQP